MTFKWSAGQYEKFSGQRFQAASDLLNHVRIENPEIIYDLGCGTGSATKLIAENWPEACVVGVDSSEVMLTEAKSLLPSVEFLNEDIAQWRPKGKVDFIYSNAALHWVDDHKVLLPQLFSYLKPGGVLAIQMPNNAIMVPHQLVRKIAGSNKWQEELKGVNRLGILAPREYYTIMSSFSDEIDIWQTEYFHVLAGDNPVLEWMKGAALRPYISALTEKSRQAEFIAEVAESLQSAFPQQKDGKTLLSYSRFFMVLRKPLAL